MYLKPQSIPKKNQVKKNGLPPKKISKAVFFHFSRTPLRILVISRGRIGGGSLAEVASCGQDPGTSCLGTPLGTTVLVWFCSTRQFRNILDLFVELWGLVGMDIKKETCLKRCSFRKE